MHDYRTATWALWLTGLLLVSGCAETSREEANGRGNIRGIHAIVDAPELGFLIEEQLVGPLDFRQSAGFAEWDGLQYNFNFDLLLIGQPEAIRVASASVTVEADTEHTIVLTGSLDNPNIMTWQAPEGDFDETDTVFEADFVHLSPQLGQVDVYYAVEGTVPMIGTEIATMSNGDRIDYQSFPEGTYELIITAPGDPGMVLFQSSALIRAPRERITVALFDSDRTRTANVAANIIFSGGSQELADINSPSQLRVLHAAFGTGNIDAYRDDDFAMPFVTDLPYTGLSVYTDVTEAVTPLDFTPTGDPNTLLADLDFNRNVNGLSTVALWGAPDALFLRSLQGEGRPLSLFPLVRFSDFAANVDAIDVYEVDPGTVIDDDVNPKFLGLVPGLSTPYSDIEPGPREFVVTLFEDKTPISAARLQLNLSNGDVADVMIVDTADPTQVEFIVWESVP